VFGNVVHCSVNSF